MTLFSKRLPHVLTRKDLALIIAPTYAAAARVDFDEAYERLERAVTLPRVHDALYEGISAALHDIQGPRLTEDALVDKLSGGLEKRRSKVKAANVTPAISAALVLIDLELGYAAEMMRSALETPKGVALLKDGMRALGAHLLRELIK